MTKFAGPQRVWPGVTRAVVQLCLPRVVGIDRLSEKFISRAVHMAVLRRFLRRAMHGPKGYIETQVIRVILSACLDMCTLQLVWFMYALRSLIIL